MNPSYYASPGYQRLVLTGTDSNGSGVNLTFADDSTEITLPDASSFSFVIDVTASRTDAQAMGGFYRKIRGHTTGGTLTIDVTPGTKDDKNGTAYAFAVTAPSGLKLRLTGTGTSGHTVKFTALVDLHITPGH